MWQKLKIPLTILSIVTTAVVIASAWKMSVTSMTLQANSIELKCETSCSQTKIRTPQVILTFKAAESQLSQIALETTVFSEGFALGILARLTGITREGRFQVVRPENQRNVGGLSSLTIAGVEVSEPTGMVRVTIEGLEPGLNYQWRLRSLDLATALSDVAICQAPACPFDQIEEQIIQTR